MIKNYLKTAFRSLWRNKGYSFLNIAGLSIGMTAFFLIFLYVRFELSYDSFHPKADRIYRVVSDVQTPTGLQHFNAPPMPAAIGMKDQLPEIELTTRVSLGGSGSTMVTRDNAVFELDDVVIADGNFLRVLDFPLFRGDPKTALQAPRTIVLSRSAAKKFFGRADPLGKILLLARFKLPCTVTGVMADMPGNSSIKASMIASVSTFERMDSSFNQQWGNYGWCCYALLKPGASAAALQARFPGYLERFGGTALRATKNRPTLLLEPLRDIYLYSTRDDSKSGHIGNVYIFSVIGAFILLIAAINFVNLTTARSMDRAKEVGIRRVVGAGKGMVVVQFIGESIIVCVLAYVVAVGLAALLLPLFNKLAGQTVSTGIFSQPRYVLMLLCIGVLTGGVAGLYPALVLSSFRPLAALKKGIVLRKALVIVQFTIAIGLMIATMVVYFQLSYMRNQDLGFTKEQQLILNTRGDSAKLAFRQALGSIPGVRSTAMSDYSPGMSFFSQTVQMENNHGDLQPVNILQYTVDYDYLDQLHIPVVAGRNFSRKFGTDSTNAMLINETAVRQLGLTSSTEAIGKRLEQYGRPVRIVGVVKDFHIRSLQEPILPMILDVNPGGCDLITVSVDGQHLSATLAAIEAKWKQLLPSRPWSYFFLDEFFNRQYRAEQHFGRLFLNFAILAILISCLGLMGLAAYSTVQRTKEIGIRKVVGASVANIVYLLSREFLLLVGWAFLVAAPLAGFFIHSWLNGFAYRIPSYWLIFVLAGAGALAIALATMSVQAIKAAMANPIDSLRAE